MMVAGVTVGAVAGYQKTRQFNQRSPDCVLSQVYATFAAPHYFCTSPIRVHDN